MPENTLKPGDIVWYSRQRSGGYWEGLYKAKVLAITDKRIKIECTLTPKGCKQRIIAVSRDRLEKTANQPGE